VCRAVKADRTKKTDADADRPRQSASSESLHVLSTRQPLHRPCERQHLGRILEAQGASRIPNHPPAGARLTARGAQTDHPVWLRVLWRSDPVITRPAPPDRSLRQRRSHPDSYVPIVGLISSATRRHCLAVFFAPLSSTILSSSSRTVAAICGASCPHSR